jgi:hypothetical protein
MPCPWNANDLPKVQEQRPGFPRQTDDLPKVKRKKPKVNEPQDAVQGNLAYLLALSKRLEKVKVQCKDWKLAVTRCVLTKAGRYKGKDIAVFLDPPYKWNGRDTGIYGEDRPDLAGEVEEWCRDKPYKIALCGLVGDYDLPGWRTWTWGKKKECVWLNR